MSGTKRAIYDWDSHFPKMIALYRDGYSFPDIAKMIQKPPDFKPSEKAVYNKLRQAGWPTERSKRASFCKHLNKEGSWPQGIDLQTTMTSQQCLPNAETPDQPHESEMIDGLSSHNIDINAHPSKRVCHDYANLSTATNSQPQTNATDSYHQMEAMPKVDDQEWQDSQSYLSEFAKCLDNGQEYPIGEVGTQFPLESLETPLLPDEVHQQLSCPLDAASFPTATPCASLQSSSGTQLLNFKQGISTPVEVPDMTDASSLFSTSLFPATPGVPGPAVIAPTPMARQLDRWKSTRRGSKILTADRNSSSTYDSGYRSGRSSPFSLHVLNRQAYGPAVPKSFGGLHRASSQTCNWHEPRPYNKSFSPQTPDRYRDVPTCKTCQYSAIHNLSWSAQYHKFEVFASELKLSSKYDLVAIDAAGNCALHYAAAGGAKIEYITALIQAGVNPCQINTAGELFLHCLSLCFDQAELDFETKTFPSFKTNLINLLNYLGQNYSGFFRWRDNGGRTGLDAFVSSIDADHDIKSRVIETVASAGYTLELLDPSTNNVSKSQQCGWSTFLDIDPEDPFNFNKVKQRLAREVAPYASTDPSYIHPETGDNILHALARFRLQEPIEHVNRIQHYADMDVDLNQRNRDEDAPLSVYTQEPPVDGATEDETGATISKYLDAILWKDPQKRFPRQVNVNMRNREGLTPLYYAAMRARPDSVRSLIEAGANVNARLNIDGAYTSILHCAEREAVKAEREAQLVMLDRLKNVISYLEHANAVVGPTLFQERRITTNTVAAMPI